MAGSDFNRDMDDYLRRKKGGVQSNVFRFKFSSDSPSTEIIPRKEKPAIDEGDFTEEEVKMAMQGKLERKPMTQVESGSSRPGLFSRIFGSRKQYDDEYDEEAVAEKVREHVQKVETANIPPDVTEVLTIAGRWLNRLDPETKMEFKESTDYAKYKFLLDRLRNR